MIAVWPEGMRQSPSVEGWQGGPQDGRAAFQPAIGPDITRRRTTAVAQVFQARFPALTHDQFAVWEAFYNDTLDGGTLPFAWRDPVRRDVARWRVGVGEAPYSITAIAGKYADLSMTLMRLPGTPVWAPYVLTPQRVPYAVADYDAGVFALDALPATAADVALVAGTYDVHTVATNDSVTIETAHVVTAGDIPATAPVGVKRIVAYA